MATSTRNLLRSLGAVSGVAVSTAIQYAVIDADLRGRIPETVLRQVLDGSWSIGASGTEAYQPLTLDAKMKGYRVVFITLVPLMCVCLSGKFLVADIVLQGDPKKTPEEWTDGSEPGPSETEEKLKI